MPVSLAMPARARVARIDCGSVACIPNPARSRGGMIGIWQRLFQNRKLSRATYVLFICLQYAPYACAVDKSLESYRDLKPISFFGSISVSVHDTTSENSERDTGFSSEELTQYLRNQFTRYFTDIPYRSVGVSTRADPENSSSMGRLSCRVWVDGQNTPALFQVKCQISTPDHFNIIDDTSFGYGPREKATSIVSEQIDRLMQGFSRIFFRVRNEL